MIWLYILIIIGCCVVLFRSSMWMVKSLNFLANYYQVPEFAMAFVLAGLATSLPELTVGILSGLNKISVLSLGNILGANFADITLILGLPILLIKGLKIETKFIKSNIIYTFLIVIFPLLLLLDGQISRLDGVTLIILYILYIIFLFQRKSESSETFVKKSKKDLWKNISLFILGIVFLLISAKMIVWASQSIAQQLNVRLFIIGVFLLALGTTMPELSFNLKAGKNHPDMILGNILGSVAVNSSLILGIVAIISPIVVLNIQMVLTTVIFLIGAFALLAFLGRTEKQLSWREGLVLIFIYIGFLITTLIKQ
ncbi:MAG: sodium:calcium antiporter [Patescibacteria group bacterium]